MSTDVVVFDEPTETIAVQTSQVSVTVAPFSREAFTCESDWSQIEKLVVDRPLRRAPHANLADSGR